MIGSDPESAGLERAWQGGLATTPDGIEGFLREGHEDGVQLVFDARPASPHARHDAALRRSGF